MTGTPRNEDERAGRTHDLPVIDEHDVFAIEHVERLGAVVMHMKRGPKARWFFGFQYRHETPRVAFCGLHRHAEIAQVNEPSLAWTEHIRLRTLHGPGEVARSSEFRQHRGESTLNDTWFLGCASVRECPSTGPRGSIADANSVAALESQQLMSHFGRL